MENNNSIIILYIETRWKIIKVLLYFIIKTRWKIITVFSVREKK